MEQQLVHPVRKSPPLAVLRGSSGSDSVQLRGIVNGHPTSFVVDSGANRRLVRGDILSRSQLRAIPNGLADVTGRRTVLYGPKEVCLSISGHDYRQNVCLR